MRKTCLLIAALALVAGLSAAQEKRRSSGPQISLFESVDTVKHFLATKAKQDYSDKYLNGISLHFSQGHPRKGPCWLYHFAFNEPRMGGDVCIYHFMDGEIIEFKTGP